MTVSQYRVKVIAAWRVGCLERAESDRREDFRGWFVPPQRTPTP